MGPIATPAFAGANFDSSGSCLRHPEVKLTQKTTIDGGKVVYKELRRRCPKCTSRESRSSTSPDIKRVESQHSHASSAYSRRERRPHNSHGHSSNSSHSNGNGNNHSSAKSPPSPHPHGKSPSSPNPNNPSLAQSSSRSRPRSKSPSRDRARSRSRVVSGVPARKAKNQFSTPFDAKGICHYHPNVQLAKKKLTGGWKLLHANCPKCAEDKYSNDDNRSVASRRSNKSSRSAKSSRGRGQSSSGGRKKNRPPKFECPFNSKGYCHRHAHVRLAKKKLTGGWKILQQFCVECVKEDDGYDDNRSECSRSSRISRKSTCSRSSRRSVGSRKSVGTKSRRPSSHDSGSELSTSQSEPIQKTMVKRMNYTDDNGEEGLYTGYVNAQCKPHGNGKLVYGNGKRFSGEWCEGTKVHGKTSNEKHKKKDKKERRDKNREAPKSPKISSKNGTSNSSSAKATTPMRENEATEKRKLDGKQHALKEYKELYNTAQVVKNMVFVDFYGDRGRYTGEVNGQKVPHGTGEITYDHGLVQGGVWSLGVLDDEGSITSGREGRQGEKNYSSSSRRRGKSKDP